MAISKDQPGDIFAAPPYSILIHACNARGSWGAGVALAFKKKYLTAFKTYNSHCLTPNDKTPLSKHQQSLVGTTLLIPPGPKTPHQHWIACLFTSQAYGRNVSPPQKILESSKKALQDLSRQVEILRRRGQDVAEGSTGDDVIAKEVRPIDAEPKQETKQEGPGECWAVRINSGMFGVPWQDTKDILAAGFLDMTIVRPADEDEGVSDEGERATPASKVIGKAVTGRAKRKPDDTGQEDTGNDQNASKRAKLLQNIIPRKAQKNGLDGWLKG